MDFIQGMKKRDYVRLSCITAICVLLGLIVIFLMEGMIYSIYLNAIMDNQSASGSLQNFDYYIEELDDNLYNVYRHENIKGGSWLCIQRVSKSYLDGYLKPAGDLYTTDNDLFKIVAYAPETEPETFETDSSDSSYTKMTNKFKDSHTGVTFDIFVRENETAEYGAEPTYDNYTYEQVVALKDGPGDYLKGHAIYWRKPNCFDIYMNATHYVVMVLFELVIIGVFVWRFTLVSGEYKKIERHYQKTGKISGI